MVTEINPLISENYTMRYDFPNKPRRPNIGLTLLFLILFYFIPSPKSHHAHNFNGTVLCLGLLPLQGLLIGLPR